MAEPQPPRTIFVVEDEPAVRELVRVALQDQGFDVVVASNGNDALELAVHHPAIDVMITDVIMPDLSGPELARRFRFLHPETRVLFMSGYSGDTIVQHGFPAHGAELIQKPCSVRELLERVRTLLGSP